MREHTPATDLLAAWPGPTFTTSERLYHLTGLGPAAALAEQLLIESWTLHEALSQPYVLQIHALSTDARLPVGDLLGQFLVLHTLLADGSRSPRSGIVLATQALESDGGLARFALTLGPWSALNEHVFGSGLHQGVTAAEIAERSWRRLAPRADWAWSADVAAHLSHSPFHDDQAASPGRRLCSQYRESDHAFIQRLLAEEGIGYAFEEAGAAPDQQAGDAADADHPAGSASSAHSAAPTSPHRLSAFADSTVLPWDDTVQRDGAIRFHQAGATQAQDAVQAWGCTQRFSAARTSVLAWHRKAKRAVAATSATAGADQGSFAAPGAPRLEHYLISGPSAGSLSTTEQAERAATLLREAEECRLQLHIGRSTVRTLRAGRRIRLAGAPEHNGEYLVTAVAHAGFNNLPKELAQTVERRIGPARLPLLPRPDASWSDEARAVLDARHADADGAAGGASSAASGAWAAALDSPFGDLFSAAFGESFQLAADGRALSRRPLACGLADDVIAQAQRTGYANALCAIPAATPWRPQRWRTVMPPRTSLAGAGAMPRMASGPSQQPLHPKPEAPPVTTAIVVGPQGEAVPTPGQEIHTDRLGRIRVRFHWQAGERPDDTHTPWLRVAQRLAGPGMGWHFTPRIGQEVLVGFLCNDIDQPIVLGALYNGQGEAGVMPTPGGKAAGSSTSCGKAAGSQPGGKSADSASSSGRDGGCAAASHSAASDAHAPDAHAPDASTDHRAAAQGNRIGTGAGGHAPAWHGAAARSQANAAAFTGIKSSEFSAGPGPAGAGGADHVAGHNQLVFDDTPGQLRTQLATTQHATQLNLGHLIHQADNHRGSLRGQGWELRTDAWGAVRAASGVLLTTYGLRPGGNSSTHTPSSPDPAGDNTAGLALARQMAQQAQALSQAAAAHQTVALAAHQGSHRAKASTLSDTAAPLHALQQALAGEVHGASLQQALADAPAWMQQAAAGGASGTGTGTGTEPGAAKPHTAAPVIAATARAGFIQAAGQDIVAAAQDALHLATGGHSSQAIGGQGRTHTGQAIGVLAAAIQPGGSAGGIGLSFIAAQGDITAQAQAGPLQLAAQDTVRLQSASRHIDWTAAKRIVLSVSGGASLTIDASGITVQCPGKLTIQAAQKRLIEAGSVDAQLSPLPDGAGFQRRFVLRRLSDGQPLPAQRYRMTLADGRTIEGTTNEQGETELAASEGMQSVQLDLLQD